MEFNFFAQKPLGNYHDLLFAIIVLCVPKMLNIGKYGLMINQKHRLNVPGQGGEFDMEQPLVRLNKTLKGLCFVQHILGREGEGT
ncbi:Uncharacterised protein [uncultured archaeon]|nr:Uncharacterised protein [uncultured archaeon]